MRTLEKLLEELRVDVELNLQDGLSKETPLVLADYEHHIKALFLEIVGHNDDFEKDPQTGAPVGQEAFMVYAQNRQKDAFREEIE